METDREHELINETIVEMINNDTVYYSGARLAFQPFWLIGDEAECYEVINTVCKIMRFTYEDSPPVL